MNPVAVLFALPIEARAFLAKVSEDDRLDLSFHACKALVGGRQVFIGITGMGCRNSEIQTAELLSKAQPSALLFAGFGGALDPKLKPGDLVAADSVIFASDTGMREYPAHQTLLDSAANSTCSTLHGRILTTDHIIHTPEEKADLWENQKCSVVDMESGPAADVAARFGVPFLAVRSIIDTAFDVLPDVLAQQRGKGEPASPARILLAAVRRPALFSTLYHLFVRSRLAASNLSTFLEDVLS